MEGLKSGQREKTLGNVFKLITAEIKVSQLQIEEKMFIVKLIDWPEPIVRNLTSQQHLSSGPCYISHYYYDNYCTNRKL